MRPADEGDVLVSRIGILIGMGVGIVVGAVGGLFALMVLSLVAIYVTHGFLAAMRSLDRRSRDE